MNDQASPIRPEQVHAEDVNVMQELMAAGPNPVRHVSDEFQPSSQPPSSDVSYQFQASGSPRNEGIFKGGHDYGSKPGRPNALQTH